MQVETVPRAPVTVQVVAETAALDAIESDWHELFAAQPHAHLSCTHAYVIARATEKLRESRWRCYLAYANHRLAGGLIGCRGALSRKGVSIPIFDVGSEFVADVLLRQQQPQQVLDALLDNVLQTQRDCALVQFSRLTEPAFRLLTTVLDGRKQRYSWNHAAYGYQWDTRTDSAPLFSRLGASTRQLIRRTQRKFLKNHSIEIEKTESSDPGRNLEILDRFITLEASGWKGREGGAIKYRPGSAEHFRAIVSAAAPRGIMRWYTLNASGRPAAMHMCMRTHDTVWMPKIAFDEELAEYRPGQELLYHVLQDCIDDDAINRLDFISSPTWLDNWRPERQPHFELRVFNSTLLGRGVAALDWARRAARSAQARQAMELADQERRYL